VKRRKLLRVIYGAQKSDLLQFTLAFGGSWFIFVSLGRSLDTQQTSR